MKSLSEIDTTSKRATRAAGFSWGIAEEVGKNMRLLELFGLSGIKNLNKYLKDYKKKQFQKISLISNINESVKIPFCPIILGTNFIDQVKYLDKVLVGISNSSQFKKVLSHKVKKNKFNYEILNSKMTTTDDASHETKRKVEIRNQNRSRSIAMVRCCPANRREAEGLPTLDLSQPVLGRMKEKQLRVNHFHLN